MHRVIVSAIWLSGMMFLGPLGCSGTGGNAGAHSTSEETAVRVYREVQPSVVSLNCAECSGTGILLTADGLILTNVHVVISPLPYQCTVDVGEGDDARQVTFKKVTHVGFHPHDDLALVKVDPAELGVKLKPVVISREKAVPGQKVFAIGNPGEAGRILRKSIVNGIISAVDRTSNGDNCYQIDAAINPGNSGGPICDRDGKVLAIAASEAAGLQGIAFALPLKDLDTHAFVEIMQHKADPGAAKAFAAMADKRVADVNAAAQDGTTSDSYRAAATTSLATLIDALATDPTNADLYTQMADLDISLNRDAAVIAYLVRYFRMRPWDARAAHYYEQLGISLGKSKLYGAEALAYQEGLAKFPWNGHLWERMAFGHDSNKQTKDAAYCASVAIFLGVQKSHTEDIKKLHDATVTKLSADEKKELDAKVTDAAILAALDQMMAESNAARQRKQLYMIPGFATFLASSDGPPVADAAAHVPLKLEERPQRFKGK